MVPLILTSNPPTCAACFSVEKKHSHCLCDREGRVEPMIATRFMIPWVKSEWVNHDISKKA